jgi:hypothetical protein
VKGKTMNIQKLFSALLLGVLLVVSAVQPAACQQIGPPKEQMKASGNSEQSDSGSSQQRQVDAEPKLVGRLPRYFSAVVLPEQRLQIYRIQMRYRAEIEELQRKLDELKMAEAKEVEQVLSADQLERVMSMRQQARQRLQIQRASAGPPASQTMDEGSVGTGAVGGQLPKQPSDSK